MNTSQSYIAVIMCNDFAHEVTRAFPSRAEADAAAKQRIGELLQSSVDVRVRFHYSVHPLTEAAKPSQTDGCASAIEKAHRIAMEAGHRSVGTQHLLLAVLHDESLATQALALMGIFVDWTELHAHVLALTNPNA